MKIVDKGNKTLERLRSPFPPTPVFFSEMRVCG